MSDPNDAFSDDPEKNVSRLYFSPMGLGEALPGLAKISNSLENLRIPESMVRAGSELREALERIEKQREIMDRANLTRVAIERQNSITHAMDLANRQYRIFEDARRMYAADHLMVSMAAAEAVAKAAALHASALRLEKSFEFSQDVIARFAEYKTDALENLGSTQPAIILPMAVVDIVDTSQQGKVVVASAIPWLAIMKGVQEDPDFLFRFVDHPHNFEEFIAASYDRSGFEVTLTPRSGDLGRDVIASVNVPGAGRLVIYDQVKAYKPGHRVPANDVRAILGVISRDQNVSKGLITTSSDFAPGVASEFQALTPSRLELRDGRQLREWLLSLL